VENAKLFDTLMKIWQKIDEAKRLVDEGKEVHCSNRLQGGLTVLSQLIGEISQEMKEKNELV